MKFVKSGICRILQWFAKHAPSTQASAPLGKGLPSLGMRWQPKSDLAIDATVGIPHLKMRLKRLQSLKIC
jgi:hypothetical protein